MAKIKIQGRNELVEVSNQQAKAVQDELKIKTSGDNMIHLGQISVKKSSIVAVFLDEDIKEDTNGKKMFQESVEKRKKVLLMTADERAKHNAWGHFNLFYWMVYKKSADVAMKDKVLSAAAGFYSENPNWAVPSMKLWWSFLEVPEKFPVNKDAYRILERVEINELKEIDFQKQFSTVPDSFSKNNEEDLANLPF